MRGQVAGVRAGVLREGSGGGVWRRGLEEGSRGWCFEGGVCRPGSGGKGFGPIMRMFSFDAS